jgi:hypothetical protein
MRCRLPQPYRPRSGCRFGGVAVGGDVPNRSRRAPAALVRRGGYRQAARDPVCRSPGRMRWAMGQGAGQVDATSRPGTPLCTPPTCRTSVRSLNAYGGSNPSPPIHPQRAVAFRERALSLSGRSASRLRRSARGCAAQGLRRPLRGRRTLSAHCEESHVVVPARNERHNHAAFGGLRASRARGCEPTRSGAVTLFVPLWGRCASLFASLW